MKFLTIFSITIFTLLLSGPAFGQNGTPQDRSPRAGEPHGSKARTSHGAPSASQDLSQKNRKRADKHRRETLKSLPEEDRKNFKEIIQAAKAEKAGHVNRNMLAGFLQFVTQNLTGTCQEQDLTASDYSSLYGVTGKEKADARIREARARTASRRKHGKPQTGLVCTAGTKKVVFTGLPAHLLKKFYNSKVVPKTEKTAQNQQQSQQQQQQPPPQPPPAKQNHPIQATSYSAQSANDMDLKKDMDSSTLEKEKTEPASSVQPASEGAQ